MEGGSEFILTILGAMAQQESEATETVYWVSSLEKSEEIDR